MNQSMNTADIREVVARVVAQTPVTDLHTHLYAPAFGPLLLWGIDEMLTYHYLAAEVLRVSDMPYEAYWALPKKQQAELIWRELFIERSPMSEACRGVLTALDRLGLDMTERDLNTHRDYFMDRRPEDHVDTVLKTANLKCVVMTNDPFDPLERPVWMNGFAGDKRFHAALRLDALLNDWGRACATMREWGYDTEPGLGSKTVAEIRRLLDEWTQRMGALYMAASFPPDFAFPDDSPRGRIIESCVLPAGRDNGVPFAMMIGVKRNVNPALKLAADGVGLSDVDAVARICAQYPDNRFMATMLARENQHELCVTARKFRNLMPFGCWWFLNNPSLIEEMTRMRMELLGLGFVPQHSDARVLDQVIYKWEHSRAIIAKVLADKYADLIATGWSIEENEIARDAARLLDGNFWNFLGRN
ncbi:MAG TPA: glucuronate isomerase [Candidatus Hydrogenedentes bacterium]|nr:glucuronate isomerase [Candidatus Hydrogenedentota bacterium]HRT21496.1 glucuronate isomerase [Candidatus Hydrogenedentota bacterium]HRT66200.1 glucuronate isomerase [Candidatus Hydrogenedentota bacterium]